jgi:serine/threonine protein kinase
VTVFSQLAWDQPTEQIERARRGKHGCGGEHSPCDVCTHATAFLESLADGGLELAANPEPIDLPVGRIATGVAAGLHCLHQQGYLQCDVKSANVLLDEFWTPKLCDFGESQLVSSGLRGQRGTELWMAPELRSSNAISVQSEVFSFGIVMWQLLERARPYNNLHRLLSDSGTAGWRLQSSLHCHGKLDPHIGCPKARTTELEVAFDADALNDLKRLTARCSSQCLEKRPTDLEEVLYAWQRMFEDTIDRAIDVKVEAVLARSEGRDAFGAMLDADPVTMATVTIASPPPPPPPPPPLPAMLPSDVRRQTQTLGKSSDAVLLELEALKSGGLAKTVVSRRNRDGTVTHETREGALIASNQQDTVDPSASNAYGYVVDTTPDAELHRVGEWT